MQKCRVAKTAKQAEAIRLFADNVTVCLFGGSRSGKTYIALFAIVLRAIKHPGSKHLIARYRFAHAKQSICYDTMPKVLNAMGIASAVTLNRSDWFYEFPNGSTIWVGGLDDKERSEKILGNEYASIFANEASQISYDAHETLTTRLNPAKGIKPLYVIDYNPPSKTHWGYSIFERRQFPDGRPVPDDDYAKIKMNPHDNRQHLSDGYIDRTLANLSAAKRKRFLEGEYGDDNGTLWRRDWIRYRTAPEGLTRIVVGVDPTGSKTGDECGIVVAGVLEGHYYVLDDYSLHGTPSEWAQAVAEAYTRHRADAIVAESNFGGEMVKHTIRTAAPDAKVTMVTATRGKVVRAEPISALYEQGKVWHNGVMQELEDELCMYDPATSASPNRMDALVWALTALNVQKPFIAIGR
jgi:hypothetical protein